MLKPYSIRDVQLEDGERLPLLTHDDPLGLPVRGTTEYSLTKLRARGLRPTSMRQRVDALGRALQFFDSHNIDLIARTASQDFLSQVELVALADRCREPARSNHSRPVVSSNYAGVRYSTALDYVSWVAEPVISRITDPRQRASANISLERFLKRARAVAPRRRGRDSHVDGERHGLTDGQRELFLTVIRPGDQGNPFRPRNQVRNYAVLLTAYKLGARSGEIRGLKKVDIDLDSGQPELCIAPRYHDKDDRRLDPAAAKTNGRLLHLDAELAAAIGAWLIDRKDRKKWVRAHRNPYVFVNKFGDAIEGRGYRRIVERLRAVYPSLTSLCHHVLRHDWNDRWVDLVESTGDNSAKAENQQRYAMGWSHESKMPMVYGKRAIAKSANKRILALQDKGRINE